MPELQRFQAGGGHAGAGLEWDSVWAAFDRDGGVIVEGFVGPERLARLQRELEPLITSHAPGSTTPGLWTDFHGDQTKRITGLPTHDLFQIEPPADAAFNVVWVDDLAEAEVFINTMRTRPIVGDVLADVFSTNEFQRADAIAVQAAEPLTDFFVEPSPPSVYLNFEIVPGQRQLLADSIPLPDGFELAAVRPDRRRRTAAAAA